MTDNVLIMQKKKLMNEQGTFQALYPILSPIIELDPHMHMI